MLKLNRPFVEELLAWAADLTPQNLHDVAASALDGDELAMRLSDYLVPPKVLIFNPRKIEGRGALPFITVLVDRKFFGLPASYLRRRVFDGCEECTAENDPASDAAYPDYKPPLRAAPAPRPPATPRGQPRPMTKSMPAGGPGGPRPATAPRPAAQQPPPQQQQAPRAPSAVPTKSIPKRPAEPKYDAPPARPDSH